MKQRKSLGQYFLKALPWVWLALMFIIYILYLDSHATQHLDSDMSSEMVLGKLLSVEGGILSENWYYSTELRVMNIQIVLSFFFRIFNSWHIVRILSSAVLMIIMLSSFYYLCWQMGCRKLFPLAGSVLLLPFCGDYYEFVMLGLYYYPHISISFISLGLVFHYGNARKTWEQIVVLGAGFLLSLLATLGGARQILVTYLPMVMASCGCVLLLLKNHDSWKLPNAFWKSKTISYATCSLFLFAGCFVGHRINNTLLAAKYPFRHYFSLSWKEFSLENAVTVFHGFLAELGYSEGYVMSGTTIRNGVSFLIAGLLIWCIARNIRENRGDEDLFVSFMFLSGVACYVILYTFTDMMYSQRYILPIMILIIPIFTSSVKKDVLQVDEEDNKSLRYASGSLSKILYIGLLFCIFISCMFHYQEKEHIDLNANLLEAVEVVQDEYSTGYATFWNANLVTEISDGKIDMYDWLDAKSPEDLRNVDTMYEWLQVKQHHVHPEGKVFLLFTTEEFGRYTLCQKLSKDDALYNSGGYLIFGYDNYEHMAKDLAE